MCNRTIDNPSYWGPKTKDIRQGGGQQLEVACARISAFFLPLLKVTRLSKKFIVSKAILTKV